MKIQRKQSVEDNSLMKHIQVLCMRLEVEYVEVKLDSYEEYDYPCVCPLQDTDHMKEKCFQDELCEMLEPFSLILDNLVKGRNDQDGGFGYVFIEYFLESIKEESVQVEPTNMHHPKTQGSLDQNGTIEHFICLDYMGTYNMNAASDQARCLENDILEDPY